jgi:flagellar hook protein FlgE
MFFNSRTSSLKSSLTAAEDLRRISSINIANSNTIGYKALEGVLAPDCACGDFADLLPEMSSKMYGNGGYRKGFGPGEVHLEILKSQRTGSKTKVNGKYYEGSNVDPSKEFNNIVTAASMTRSALAAIQLDNKIHQEILNLGR